MKIETVRAQFETELCVPSYQKLLAKLQKFCLSQSQEQMVKSQIEKKLEYKLGANYQSEKSGEENDACFWDL